MISDWYANLDQRCRMYITRESYIPSKIVLSVVFTRLYDAITKGAKCSHGKLSLVDLPTNCEDCPIALNLLIQDSILHAKSTSSLHPLSLTEIPHDIKESTIPEDATKNYGKRVAAKTRKEGTIYKDSGYSKGVSKDEFTQTLLEENSAYHLVQKTIKELQEGGACPICHNDVESSEEMYFLECGHMVHKVCWSVRAGFGQDNSKCPVCEASV